MGVVTKGLQLGTKAALGATKAVVKGTGNAAVDVIRSPYDALTHGVRAYRGKNFDGTKLTALQRTKAAGGLAMAAGSASFIPDVIPVGRSAEPYYERTMERIAGRAINEVE